MTPHQKIFALTVGIAFMGAILALVHKRKLKEEYAWLWLVTALIIVVLVVWYDLLVLLTGVIGAVAPTTTLFIFGMLFLIMITLHYSMQISRLSDQVRELAQQSALLKAELQGEKKGKIEK